MLARPPPAHLRLQASRRPSPVASAAPPRQRRAPHARVCPIPSDSPGAERDQKQAERGGELGLMPWEEPGESWQVPAESDPPPRLPGEAARRKLRSAGPSGLRRSLRAPRSYRPPAAAGELPPGEGRRRGRRRGPLPAQPLASPEKAAGRSRRCRLSRARTQTRGSPWARLAAQSGFA